jgi:GDP-L-fucose synthase
MHVATVDRAPRVTVGGSGTPRREFVPVDDLASAAVHVMQFYDDRETINLGAGVDLSIGDLAREIATVVGFQGAIEFDRSYPDGMPSKVLDSTRLLDLGWRPSVPFRDALRDAYEGYKSQLAVHG